MLDFTQTHPGHTPLQRIEIDKSRGLDVIRHTVETTRIAIVGTPGQQADRDRKAALALNALNGAKEVRDLQEAALAFLAAPASAMGISPMDLAKIIKGKRDNETAALMALDAYRVEATRGVKQATTHEQVESAIVLMQQGAEKAASVAR